VSSDQPDSEKREPADTTASVDAPDATVSAELSSVDTSVADATATAEPSSAVDTSAVGDESTAAESNASDTAVRTSSTVARPRTAESSDEPGSDDAGVETIVHVLRHGEVHNPKGILYGRLPGFSLSVTGRAQAGAVARALSDHDITLVIASPLQRAQETAEPIAAQHGLIVRTDENLIEAGNTFEGLRVSVGDGALRKPRHWWKLRDPFTPSWGEPYLQIAHRMLAAVNKARVEAAGHEAVLVSHQLPVWTLRRFLQGQRLWHDPRNRQCSLASLTSLVYQGDTLVDIVYSEPAGGSDPSVHGA
jgi:broad specificity phosphatase PhoE